MPKTKPKKKKTSGGELVRKQNAFFALLGAFGSRLRGNYGGLVLTATMLQLFAFLVLLGTSIDFHGAAGTQPFGRQENNPLSAKAKSGEEEKSGLPPAQTAVFSVYAGLCLAAALALRRRIAARQFRIILYLQAPGLILTGYAVARFVFYRIS